MAVSKKKNPVPSESIFVSQGSKRPHERTLHGRSGRVGVESFAERRQDSIPTPLPKKADVYLRIERKNAELRATYLRTNELYTAEDIWEQAAKKPTNPSEPSAKWKREGRVFGVLDGEKYLFPAFQFADGQPLPIIKKILKVLPEDMSPWQTAFWFEAENGWLGGEIPQEYLENESELIYAAEQLAKPVIG